MKKKVMNIVLLGLIFLLLVGSFLVVLMHVTAGNDEEVAEIKDITMFSAYTDCEEFQNVPSMITESGSVSDAEDYGDKDWLINVNGSTVEEYQTYLRTLEAAGFVKHSDNGENGMEGYAYTASFQKDNLTLTVTHAIRDEHTYIMAAYDRELSPHLIYQDSYMDGVPEDAKTSVHMLELHDIGNSFVIQLKNGHFVIHDGGEEIDAPYLLDYLEDLTPGDEKPVVEAWFISHAHGDHLGALLEISSDQKYIDRIIIDGIYFSEPNEEKHMDEDDGSEINLDMYMLTRANVLFKNQDGEMTSFYRPYYGQRYYFCDIAIDVSISMELLTEGAYFTTDFNDTSIWLMHHIDGQRFLIAGDANQSCMRMAMNMYDEEYFDMDVFAVFHHGINVQEFFTEYCTLKTVLYTSFREGSVYTEDSVTRPDLATLEGNEHLRQSCAEYVSRGNGTVVLNFPYSVGEYKKLEPCDWRYDGGIQQKVVR